MSGIEFNNERIKESAQKLAIKMRHDDPGAKGGLYIINEDGAEREASAEDLFMEPMTEEVKRLRCAVADLIAENERLKAELREATLIIDRVENLLSKMRNGTEYEVYGEVYRFLYEMGDEDDNV
ncbi:hypothetical protein [Bacillus velezensis]|uniref:hypothetical protein n=1 Tax=Bacillus velezensis TaxID=492670 RepID=UPI000DE5B748|nr:hypothetical protein [Bacillus velezensis]